MHPAVQNAMGAAQLHTPQSVFQHMMGQQSTSQETEQWMQVPQVPQLSMPWSVPSLQQPDLVRFTGEMPRPKGFFLHQKRKLEMPDLVDTRHTKQLITEEKMAAHFQQLQISPYSRGPETSSSIVTSQQDCGKFDSSQDLEMDGLNITDLEKIKKSQPKLVLSEELKRLKDEPLLPTSLLSKLERPSMALVLWEPPNKHLRVLPTPRNMPTPIPSTSGDNNNNANYNEEGNNNNETMPDLNQVLQNHNIPNFEPMDL